MALDRRIAERFHRVLVEEIRRTRPEYLEQPFTVAEIYQSLVPYRTHRDRIGVEMNADYEEALLHLLGGKEEYLILDSQPARDRIRRELASSNPNTGVFREFAALTVRLDPKQAAEVPAVGVLPGSGASPPADQHSGTRDMSLFPDTPAWGSAPAGGAAAGGEAAGSAAAGSAATGSAAAGGGSSGGGAAEVPARASGEASPGSAQGGAARDSRSDPGFSSPEDCPDCGRDLPHRPGLRYCPFCGVDVLVSACAACGEELDRAWAFCVACGTPSGFGVGTAG
ncbi:MAG: zinc ribbon domain-containing protein [Gemmatimonadales bacterium]|nr:MAG: zinc ribbon domain-containing protein [Gemmatimonadales bacterium]